ncbi:hypothetical protein V6N13_099595 [Hibiscus sabdariffa]|uniref:Uncharacterized protein n=1 Tax=Hibiscus sabdariffa TaxID=183260 RepID=A0ABR2Q0S0_9ROSI
MEDDDVHSLDDDDVEVVTTIATKGNSLDVEDDVWATSVAKHRTRLVDEPSVYGYVELELNQHEPNQLEPICSAFEPRAKGVQN